MQRLTNFWSSSVHLHVCALGGPTNFETILHLSPNVLQHHWCNSLTSCSYSVTQFGHILHLRLVHRVLERNLKELDWEKGSYRMASQATRFDPFRFLSMGVHKTLGVPSEGARCGRTESPNNCSLWDCCTSDAVKHLARGGVSSRNLSGHQGRTRGDLLRNAKS
jgi:hypothetical protein